MFSPDDSPKTGLLKGTPKSHQLFMVSILCQFSWWSLDFLKIRLISDIRIEYWIQKLEYWITCTEILVQKAKNLLICFNAQENCYKWHKIKSGSKVTDNKRGP